VLVAHAYEDLVSSPVLANSSCDSILNNSLVQWPRSVILAMWETETRKIMLLDQPEKRKKKFMRPNLKRKSWM
jgi:hypothetical protein